MLSTLSTNGVDGRIQTAINKAEEEAQGNEMAQPR